MSSPIHDSRTLAQQDHYDQQTSSSPIRIFTPPNIKQPLPANLAGTGPMSPLQRSESVGPNFELINEEPQVSASIRNITQSNVVTPTVIPIVVTPKSDKLFPNKLWDLVSNSESDLLYWRDDGRSVAFRPGPEFEKLLEVAFRTTKATSFVRSLNSYGFSKVKGYARRGTREEEVIFTHPHFRRDRPDLLPLIDRKSVYGTSQSLRHLLHPAHGLHAGTNPSRREQFLAIRNELVIQCQHTISTIMKCESPFPEGLSSTHHPVASMKSVRKLLHDVETQQSKQRQLVERLVNVVCPTSGGPNTHQDASTSST